MYTETVRDTTPNRNRFFLWHKPKATRNWLKWVVAVMLIAGSFYIGVTPPPVRAENYNVGDAAALAAAITAANASPEDDTITLTGDITLGGNLPLIRSNITFEGNNHSISGSSQYRVFFVGRYDSAPTVTFRDLTIQNGKAQGGSGESGGAGLGGGLFVYTGTVTVENVTFVNNNATGGDRSSAPFLSGGGGMGGNGGTNGMSSYGGGGGGLWAGANGGNAAASGTGGAGGSAGDFGGGGGGAYTGGNGGGVNGGLGSVGTGGGGGGLNGGNSNASAGGGGGWGGGGGGGGAGGGSQRGGNGGFGGGGGGGTTSGGCAAGGSGGFGGGGGLGSSGGFGGGGGTNCSGGWGGGGQRGGGAGLGGGVFVRAGALTLKNAIFNSNSANHGVGDTNGQGKGGGLFLCTSSIAAECSARVTAASCGVAFSGNTAQDDASTTTDNDDLYGDLGSATSSCANSIQVVIAKSVVPTGTVPYHGAITYTVALVNHGTLADSNVVFTDALPTAVNFVAWIISPTNTLHVGNAITWTGGLAAGEALTWTFRAVHIGSPAETVTNTAHFSGTQQKGAQAVAFLTGCDDPLVVQNTHDSGPCSLREAVTAAQPGDAIGFAGTLAGQTLTLGSSLGIHKNLTIDGSALATPITLRGNFAAPVLLVSSNARVTLSGLTIMYGAPGIQIDTGAEITLMHSTVITNVRGVYNQGTLTVMDSVLSQNLNSGIYNEGVATVTHSLLSGNSASEGGGLYNPGVVTVKDSTFANNSASGSHGGGIYNAGTADVQNSTVSGNSASGSYGGGIFNMSALTLTNSTLSDNSATGGGGIANSGALSYRNTIIANSTGGDCFNINTISTSGYNLVEDGSCPGTPTDPRLGALANYGGGIPTHALLPTSPAIDAGDGALCPTADQRGFARADLRCDIGAFERQFSDGDTVIKTGFAGWTPYSFGPTRVSMILATASAGTITVTKHLAYPGGGQNTGEVQATWWISSSLTSGFPLALSLCYTDAEVAGLNEGSLEMFRWVDGVWVDQNATPNPGNNCITLAGVTGFSAWTLKDVSVGADKPTVIKWHGLQGATHFPSALHLGGLAFLALGGAAALKRRR